MGTSLSEPRYTMFAGVLICTRGQNVHSLLPPYTQYYKQVAVLALIKKLRTGPSDSRKKYFLMKSDAPVGVWLFVRVNNELSLYIYMWRLPTHN